MRWIPAFALLLALPLAAEEPNPVEEFFTRWDANKDGTVTRDECESTRLFGQMDRNADGTISRAEVEANWKEEGGGDGVMEPAQPGDSDGTKPDRRGPGGRRFGGGDPNRPGGAPLGDDANRMRIRRIFNRFDKNGDDTLSTEEAAAYYFEVLDTDRDGALMEHELTANPQVGPEKAAMAMQALDKDGDRMIFPGEWVLPDDGKFAQIDQNGDKRISFEEALAGFRLKGKPGETTAQPADGPGRGRALDPEKIIAQMDADGDGRISASEFKGPEKLFGRGDANGDGYLDRAELDEAAKKMAKMLPGGSAGGKDLAQLVKRADQDGDGKVTREEWPGRPQGFDRMDKNGDGVLDASDFGEAPAETPKSPDSSEPGMDGGDAPKAELPKKDGE